MAGKRPNPNEPVHLLDDAYKATLGLEPEISIMVRKAQDTVTGPHLLLLPQVDPVHVTVETDVVIDKLLEVIAQILCPRRFVTSLHATHA